MRRPASYYYNSSIKLIDHFQFILIARGLNSPTPLIVLENIIDIGRDYIMKIKNLPSFNF